MDFEKFILENPADSTIESAGSLSEVIKGFKAKKIIKSKFALLLENAAGKRLAVVISKRVGTDLESGKINYAQLGNLDVIIGQNAGKEPRLYLSYSGGAEVSADDFLEAAENAAPATRAFNLEALTVAG